MFALTRASHFGIPVFRATAIVGEARFHFGFVFDGSGVRLLFSVVGSWVEFFFLPAQTLLELPMEDPDPPLATPEGFWGSQNLAV